MATLPFAVCAGPGRYQSAVSVSIIFDFFTAGRHPYQSFRRKTIKSTPPQNQPAGGDVEPAGWQAQKSASTRLQIVEAALRCFVELGYSGTTTTVIANKAGLSRGAMLHHFPSKIDIVRAAVEHLHAKRLKAFRKSIDRLPRDDSRPRRALEAYWEHVKHPMYVAFLELWVAARTDPELAAILAPAQDSFEREWYSTAVDLFPEWKDSGENFDLALDLVHYVMDGMAVSFLTHEHGEQEKRLLTYLENQLRTLARPKHAARG